MPGHWWGAGHVPTGAKNSGAGNPSTCDSSNWFNLKIKGNYETYPRMHSEFDSFYLKVRNFEREALQTHFDWRVMAPLRCAF